MVTDYDYRYIAEDVYNVDKNKVAIPYKKGDLVVNDNFQVLDVEDNPMNGMQAMAVASLVS